MSRKICCNVNSPAKRANRAWFRGFCLLAESVCGAPDHRPPVAVTSTTCSCPPKHWGTQAHSYLILSLSHTHTPPLFVICPPYQCVHGRAITYSYPLSPCPIYNPRGGYSSSSRAGRLGRTLWPQNSTSVTETEKGGQNSTMTPPTLEKGVNILHQYEKSAKKRGQKSTILKNIGVKILQVWKWGSKFYMLKNRGQNSTMLEKRGSIFYIRPQK